MMKIIGVIPSRYGSTRFPGKPLFLIKGKTLVERVYRQARKAKFLDDVVIATDDRRIFTAAEGFGARVVMTSPRCKSGTDRLAEVARKYFKPSDVLVNIQGDEPLISPVLIDKIAREFIDNAKLDMATAVCRVKDKKDALNPNIVKAVIDRNGYALYFSRAAIPFTRSGFKGQLYKHIGIYGYRAEFLARFSKWPQAMLEKTEMLEQLRALENGVRIKTVISVIDSAGVDVPSDIKKIEKRLNG